jgi:hypothetical protein
MFDKCLAETFSNNNGNTVDCCSLPGFDSIQSLIQALLHVPNGPKMAQSNGRTLCDVWGGSVSKEMSFSFATMMAAIDTWDSCLSKIKRTGSSSPDVSHAIKCFGWSATNL